MLNGRSRVPLPAAVMTAFLILPMILLDGEPFNIFCPWLLSELHAVHVIRGTYRLVRMFALHTVISINKILFTHNCAPKFVHMWFTGYE